MAHRCPNHQRPCVTKPTTNFRQLADDICLRTIAEPRAGRDRPGGDADVQHPRKCRTEQSPQTLQGQVKGYRMYTTSQETIGATRNPAMVRSDNRMCNLCEGNVRVLRARRSTEPPAQQQRINRDGPPGTFPKGTGNSSHPSGDEGV